MSQLAPFMQDYLKAREYLLPSLPYCNGTHEEDDIILLTLKGRFKLWLGERSAALTEVVEFPRMKCLHIFLAGGDLGDMAESLKPKIEQYAEQQGCRRLTVTGRDGWQRVWGATKSGTAMYRELSHG